MLFVNVSIGVALTPYAAAPVLMVAGTWDWGLYFVLNTFGWWAAIAVMVNAAADFGDGPAMPVAVTVTVVHLLFLKDIVLMAQHSAVFIGTRDA